MNDKRCTNVKTGHTKGHQYIHNPEEPDGIWIRGGQFTASYNPSLFTTLIVEHLELLNVYDAEIHRQVLQNVPLKDWLHRIDTNSTCLSCLSNNPEHVLPCRHVLCSMCIATFDFTSRANEHLTSSICITSCPFGCAPDGPRWPWKSSMKPPSAGVRVLSLDGGGIRGVLELIVLHYLQAFVADELGTDIPIIEMFDLVVGTSTGGIIAIGLGHCLWNTEDSIIKFTDLASKIFSPRRLAPLPFFKYLYGHKYRSSIVEKEFQDLFSKNELLISNQRTTLVKVAVTAVSNKSGPYKPYLMANYSRPFVRDYKEWLVRPDTYEKEIKVWEA